MQVGAPGQNLRLMPSDSGNAVWPVLPQGCIVGDPENCGDLRGYLFLPNASSTWNNTGLYSLVLTEEVELGYSGNANFGYDDLTLVGLVTDYLRLVLKLSKDSLRRTSISDHLA